MFHGYTSGQEAITGTSTAYTYIDLGTDDEKLADELVKKIIDDIPEDFRKYLKARLEKTGLYYTLRLGASRAGKIDIQAGKNATVSFSIVGEPTPQMSRVINLLTSSSFSVKSYKTSGAIEFGKTSPIKAVSAITSYAANRIPEESTHIIGAGIYYAHHPANDRSDEYLTKKNITLLPQLYENYEKMIRIYELSGMGLRYDDIEDLTSVDFLLVNRAAEGGDIQVFAVNDLLLQLEHSSKIKVAI